MLDLVNLPPELLLLIVNELAATPHSKAALSSLSLSCQYFLPLCREHIFSSIRLHDDIAILKLLPLIEANPLLQCYVRAVDFTFQEYSTLRDNSLAASLLEHFTQVQDFQLSSRRACSASKSMHLFDSKPPLRRAVIRLITSPQLKRLFLHFWWIPYQLFSLCAVTLEDLNLQQLVLYDASPEDLEKISDLGIGRSSAQRTLTSFECDCETYNIQNLGIATSNYGPIFDFSNLQSFSIVLNHKEDTIKNVRFVLQEAEKLGSLHIEVFNRPDGVSSISTMVNASVYSTLTKLSLSNVIEGVHDPFSHICDELGPFTSLRELHFEIEVAMDCDCQTGDEWAKLDTAIFEKCSMVSARFRLTIDITIRVHMSSGEELKERLERIPEQQLTRIRQHKNIDFEFSVRIYQILSGRSGI